MSLMAANEESDPSAILNGFWVTLFVVSRGFEPRQAEPKSVVLPLHHETITTVF